jgi:hypothetical protein
VLRIFIALKKSIALAGFEPANLGSSGKHTNHYTTEATVHIRIAGRSLSRDTDIKLACLKSFANAQQKVFL